MKVTPKTLACFIPGWHSGDSQKHCCCHWRRCCCCSLLPSGANGSETQKTGVWLIDTFSGMWQLVGLLLLRPVIGLHRLPTDWKTTTCKIPLKIHFTSSSWVIRTQLHFWKFSLYLSGKIRIQIKKRRHSATPHQNTWVASEFATSPAKTSFFISPINCSVMPRIS